MDYLLLLLVVVSWVVLFIPCNLAFQASQVQVLFQLRKQLEYPLALDVLENYQLEPCNLTSTTHLSIICEENSVTELKVMGDRFVKVKDFNGHVIPNETLSDGFSIDSFVTTLTRLPSLKVLSLVSLGIWGPLPDKIHRLSSLEILDMSSNYMFGSIPVGISRLFELQSLTMDTNFFNGSVPDWWDLLENLTILSLKGNRLKGPFPASMCRVASLTDIALSHNELSGKLPDMSGLNSLHVLDLRENELDSGLPILPKGVITVLLSKNLFSGEIPQQFGELLLLQHLDLSYNHLKGTPPSDLFSLPNLSYLHLSSNMFSGTLPNRLICGRKLGFVDISNNKFIGELPPCLDSTSDKRVVRYSGNCLSIVGQHQHQESYCREASMSKQSRIREIGILVAVIGGAVLLIILFGSALLFLFRRYWSRVKVERHSMPKVIQENLATGVSPEILTNARFISQVAKAQSSPAYRLFSLEELKQATNNFNSSSFLGEGSKGKIHKGRLENGTYVAIRSLALSKKYSIRNLKVRLDFLSKLHHPHLVALLGHCIEGGGQDEACAHKIFLVYEYVPNGDYRGHLSENFPEKVLRWSDRLAILIGVAKAVHFLHTGVIPGAFNNQLRTSNILIDEHRIAKLSDYGMRIITEEIDKQDAKGEGLKSRQKAKLDDDVYNFGFILLESLVGPIVTGKGEAYLLSEMTSFGSQDGRKRIVDPIVLTTCSQESLSIVVSITNKCISPEPSSRPSFEDVLWNLQYAAQVQATADSEQKSDSTS